MARITPSIGPQMQADHTGTVVTIAGVIGALYFGSEILIPIALAILLSFALAPAVKLLQKLGLGRVAPVLITVLITFAFLAGLGALLASQLRDLSADLPRYEGTIVRKIELVKGMTDSGGIKKLEDVVTKFSKAVDKSAQTVGTEPDGATGQPPALGTPAAIPQQPAPMQVQVVQPAMGPLDAILLVSTPLVHPLSIAVIVLIFVVFILLQREDLRNRAIRLFGANDLQRATAAINDGGKRLSRYLLAQCALNASAGVVVATALWLIGVPSPILLGILFACARFVPYIGAVLGAVFPIALALAVDPGWTMVIWTVVALALVEGLAGQVIEPLAYGHNTGMSPIAVVIAATFWTVLWGPVGLFLSTPLTVCLVVLGRHVDSLSFLDVLLGDRPPLTPAETFYQRMLANDPVEAADQAQRCLAEMSILQYYDTVALPALIMAQDDAVQGRLDTERQGQIKTAALEVVEDLDHEAAETGDGQEKAKFFGFGKAKPEATKEIAADDLSAEQVPPPLRTPGSVLCIGARGPLDDASAAMLADVLTSYGIGAIADSFARLSRSELPSLDVSTVSLIVLSALDGSSPAFLRFVLRRLQRHAPHAEIVVGAWWRGGGLRATDGEIDEAIRQTKVATIGDMLHLCFTERKEAAIDASPLAGVPVLSVAS